MKFRVTYLGAVLAAVLLTACSNVIDYKKPVSDMSVALDDASNVINKYDQEQTKILNEKWRTALAASPATASLNPRDNQCSISGTGDNVIIDCSLEILLSGETEAKPFPATSVITNSKKGLALLQSYVAGLKSIVDADTAAKVLAETNKTFTHLSRLEETVLSKKKETSKIATYTASISALTKWLAENYIDHLKYKSLAQATAKAHPSIIGLEELMAGIGNAVAKFNLTAADEAYLTTLDAYDTAAENKTLTDAKINAYVKAAAEYDQALKASAAEPLKAFRKAHRKMKEHLNGEGGVSLSEVFTAVKDLKDRANEFKVIVDGFKTVKTQ